MEKKPANKASEKRSEIDISTDFAFFHEYNTDIDQAADNKGRRIKDQEDEYIQSVGIYKERHNRSDDV